MARRSQLYDRVEGAEVPGGGHSSTTEMRGLAAQGSCCCLLTGACLQAELQGGRVPPTESSGMNSTAKFEVEWNESKSKSSTCPDKAVGTVRPAFWRHLTSDHSCGLCQRLRVIPKALLLGHPSRVKGIERQNDSNPGCHHRVVQCSSVLSRLSYGTDEINIESLSEGLSKL